MATFDASAAPLAVSDCTRACARWTECAGPEHGGRECLDDCEGHLESRSAGAPAAYADCLEGLPCGDLVASLSMDLGPAGACYAAAVYVK